MTPHTTIAFAALITLGLTLIWMFTVAVRWVVGWVRRREPADPTEPPKGYKIVNLPVDWDDEQWG